MGDQLAGYAAVIGGTTGADLHRGQYHDVVVTRREAHRFPRTEAARARLPATAALLAALAQVDLGVATPRPPAAVDPTAPVGLCQSLISAAIRSRAVSSPVPAAATARSTRRHLRHLRFGPAPSGQRRGAEHF